MEGRRNLRLLILLTVLTLVAVGLAGYGWLHDPRGNVRDAIYLALRSTDGGEAYERVAREPYDNFALEAGRFLGAFVEPLAFVVVFVSLFGKSLIGISARWRRKHVVVVGSSVFADKLSEHQGAAIVHLRGIDDEAHRKGRTIRLPFSGFDARGLLAGGAAKASSIVIAPESDAQAIDLGMSAQRLYPQAQVIVRLHDFWLAERLHNTPGADRLSAISEPCLAARFVVRNYPPFLVAEDLGQTRIHALLVGDHDWLEAAMSEIILSACTLTFGKPIFSFICLEPQAFRARLVRRYPEIEAAADLYFYSTRQVDDIEIVSVDMAQVVAPAPLTAVYCLVKEGAHALSTALEFIQQAREVSDFSAPIFTLSGGHGGQRLAAGSRLEPMQILAFGDMADLVAASGVLAEQADVAEREFHRAYLKIADAHNDAAKPWDELKEEYRVSNRRAVSHMYAKLFDAGFDLRTWMEKNDVWTQLPSLAAGEALYRDGLELERLAELEHERWIADRRMSGWRYGETRDNRSKRHPDMKPYAQLTNDIQDFDRVLIGKLDEVLRRQTGTMKRKSAGPKS